MSTEIESTPGRRLRSRRALCGLRQAELATATSISVQTISQLENDRGWAGVRLETLRTVARALGLTVGELVD